MRNANALKMKVKIQALGWAALLRSYDYDPNMLKALLESVVFSAAGIEGLNSYFWGS